MYFYSSGHAKPLRHDFNLGSVHFSTFSCYYMLEEAVAFLSR